MSKKLFHQLIGNTPLLPLSSLVSSKSAVVYAKMEMFNLTGSVKDRSALGMIEAAEKDGLLHTGSTIIESTSGNLGLSLATIGCQKGYQVIIVLDPKVSPLLINEIKAYGAKIEMVEQAPEGDFQKARVARVQQLLKNIPGSINLDQYNNPNNPRAQETIGQEIYRDLHGQIDILVGCVSTGGHLCGSAHYLKRLLPHLHVVGVEPEGSVLFGGEFKPYLQNGTGLSFVPKNMDYSIIDEQIKVSDKNAFHTARLCAEKEGMLIGGSAGGALYVALEKAQAYSQDKNIVVIFPDGGNKYLNTIYNQEWLHEKGLI